MFNFIKEPISISSNMNISNEISRLEQKYNIQFPDVLKDYYCRFNNCKIKLCVFEIDTIVFEISHIVPIISQGLTFEKIVDNDRSDGYINCRYFPIAGNRGGDLYYWDSNTGIVFLIYSDDIEHPIKICNSIKDLFNMLDSLSTM